MARKLQERAPGMSTETRAELKARLLAVPDDADEHDAAFVCLLEAWDSAGVTPAAPLQAYRTHGGRWLVGDVGEVLACIRESV
jgi:hypothetical protein